ncbi:CHAD domain-containing protein [Sphingobium sp. CR2-8]|uniref:CYTH and CHAD domain-containing protein n=1 Tax=Sphingobium sp. CR2-8 TaxID=1306534 RepID=UPI002DB658E6|nr:CHAD domain-containing protein [Sphingobium sp. CR2-8]MEC3911316.1 CHAD domain-containing protein [Sphingobium sp. CR2-8]
MQPEIELKLDLSPQSADLFATWPPLQALESEKATLLATYFDTPDHRLAEHGVSLRIRRSGRRRIQTVKANGQGGAGLFSRDEWERPVRGSIPILDDSTPVAALLGAAVADIAPVFEVEVQRRTWLVSQDDAVIELVLDQGVVRAGGREQVICEIELELKSGAPAALFALARRIDADIAVRPGVLSKSERGYRLTDALPSAYKAERVALDPDVSIGAAFRQIVALCLRHYRLNEALLLDGYAPEALHQARVAIRRLRTALTLFKPLLRTEDVARFQDELRWLAGIMGDARDLDVLAVRVTDAAQRQALEAAHGVARDRVMQWLASARVRMLLIDLAEWLADGAGLLPSADRPAAPFAAERLRKLRKRIAKRGKGMKRLSDAARHGVRKDAKKLRYGAEYFGALFEGKKARRRHRAFVGKLERMQDALGALNDLVNVPATLARHGLEMAAGEGDKATLLSSAAHAHADFVDARRFWA